MRAWSLRFSVPILFLTGALSVTGITVSAQQPDGPQTSPPPSVVPPPAPSAPVVPSEKITVPAGTRVGVILENGVSTKNSKAGDSIYLRTSFPLTMNNRIVIPVGSYIRGEIIDSKRPGRVKGRGEMRLRLNTLILPNGYTVNLTAAPRSADSAAKGTMDDEGKVTSPGGKGTDLGTAARTTAETTAAGAGIGAASGSIRGVGIGAGVGALVGLGAILLTRGPDAELPRGSSLDIVLERDVALDGSQIQFKDLGQAMPAVVPVLQQQRAFP